MKGVADRLFPTSTPLSVRTVAARAQMLPLLLALAIFGAHGSAPPPTNAVAPSPSLGAAASFPAIKTTGTPKECPITEEGLETYVNVFGTYPEHRTVGKSLCSFLGVEPFEGDQPFTFDLRGSLSPSRQVNSINSTETIRALIGDVLVVFDKDLDATKQNVSVLYKAAAAQQPSWSNRPLVTQRGLTLVRNASMASDPLALSTAGGKAPRRRLYEPAAVRGAVRKLLDSGETDNNCELSKDLCRKTAEVAKGLTGLCPDAEKDRLAVVKDVIQKCSVALEPCAAPEPLEEASCVEKRGICYTRLAQLLACAAGKRCDRIVKSTDQRKLLACDKPGPFDQFSRGCYGWVYRGSSSDTLEDVVRKQGVNMTDLRRANPGRDLDIRDPICLPANTSSCGANQTVSAGFPNVFIIPVDGKAAVTLSLQPPSERQGYRKWVYVTEQQFGDGLWSSGPVDSAASKTVNLAPGTREIMVFFEPINSAPSLSDRAWSFTVDCT